MRRQNKKFTSVRRVNRRNLTGPQMKRAKRRARNENQGDQSG